MKSYTWQYNDVTSVRFSTNQAIIRVKNDEDQTVQTALAKFISPNEDHLRLYNAKITADRIEEVTGTKIERKVLAVKAMRENVPFQRTLSEVEARNRTNISRSVHGYLIQIPLATDVEKVIAFMRDNNIRWY